MKFTKVPTDVFEKLQINAGVLLTQFEPSSGTYDPENILGATTGGVNPTCVASFSDFGEDIDNCPKNTLELKQIESWECKMAGTLITADTDVVKKLIGAADVASDKVTPRFTLMSTDFTDLWYVCDYSDKNGETNGGFIAIKLINALSTGGFSLQSTDKAKGQFAFEFTGHTSLSDQDTVPMEFYVHKGTPEAEE